MTDLDWKLFKKSLQLPKLLKAGIPEVVLQADSGVLKMSAYEKRRLIEVKTSLGSTKWPEGVQYAIPFDHPIFNESEVQEWSFEGKKDTLKFTFLSNGTKKVTDIRKKSKPTEFKIPSQWDKLAEVSKAKFLQVLDHLEASANVKDTKSEEDARINAIFFRPTLSFSINRHTASVTDGIAAKNFSIPSLDFQTIRSLVDRLDGSLNVNICKSDQYLRVSQGDVSLYMTLVSSREPNFARLSDKYLYNFRTRVSDLKSLVKWSEYNADASSYLTLEFDNDVCEFKTKFKSLGTVAGVGGGSKFTVNLPSKGFVGLVDYLTGDEVHLRYSHEVMNTIFNLNVKDAETGFDYDHFIQTVRF